MTTDLSVVSRPPFDKWRRALRARGPLVTLVALVGVALFARALHSLGWAQILASLLRVGWGFALIVLVAGAREALRALAWTHTIDGAARLGFADAFRARLVGEAFSALLPMGILVGEPAKAAHVGRIVPFAPAFAGLALEFFFYSVSLLFLLAAGAIALSVTTTLGGDVRWTDAVMPAAATAALVGAAVFVLARRSLGVQSTVVTLRTRVFAGWQWLRAAVVSVARRPARLLFGVFALEMAFQVLAVAEVYITLWLISPVPPTIASAIVLETVGRLVTMTFKYLPMRVGVDEAGAAWFAGLLHLGSQTGITLAIVRKLRLLFWSGVGLALLSRERTTRWLPA